MYKRLVASSTSLTFLYHSAPRTSKVNSILLAHLQSLDCPVSFLYPSRPSKNPSCFIHVSFSLSSSLYNPSSVLHPSCILLTPYNPSKVSCIIPVCFSLPTLPQKHLISFSPLRIPRKYPVSFPPPCNPS